MRIAAPFKVIVYRRGRRKQLVSWRLHSFQGDGYSMGGTLIHYEDIERREYDKKLGTSQQVPRSKNARGDYFSEVSYHSTPAGYLGRCTNSNHGESGEGPCKRNGYKWPTETSEMVSPTTADGETE